MKKLLITGLLFITCCLSGCGDLDEEIKYDKIDNPYEKVATTHEVDVPVLTSNQVFEVKTAKSSDDVTQKKPTKTSHPVSNPVETKAPIQIDKPKDRVKMETEIIIEDDIVPMAESNVPTSAPEIPERLMPVALTDTEDAPAPTTVPEPEVEIIYEIPDMLVIDGDVDASSVNRCIEQLEYIPEKMQDVFVAEGWQLILTDKSIGTDIENTGISYMGLTRFDKEIIYVEDRIDAITTATIHEFGHFVSSHMAVYRPFANTVEDGWRDIFFSERENITKTGLDDYGTENPMEYFAETFWLYMTNPNTLATHMPQTYAYMDMICTSF